MSFEQFIILYNKHNNLPSLPIRWINTKKIIRPINNCPLGKKY